LENGQKALADKLDIVNIVRDLRTSRIFLQDRLSLEQRMMLQVQRESLMSSTSNFEFESEAEIPLKSKGDSVIKKVGMIASFGRAYNELKNFSKKKYLT
jgi:hypothetical protein